MQNKHNTGSPEREEPVFLAIGKLQRPHGLRGSLIFSIWTDFPERIVPGMKVLVGEKKNELEITDVKVHQKKFLLQFCGINDRDEAAVFGNQVVYIEEESLPDLDEGEYYQHELLGLTVLDGNNQKIGELTEIMETGANLVYIVTNEEGEETLIPVLDDVIKTIDLSSREIHVEPPEWQ